MAFFEDFPNSSQQVHVEAERAKPPTEETTQKERRKNNRAENYDKHLQARGGIKNIVAH